tara:strand:- start:694 stop:1539 length:846 start_codon:yes stop_codon:yes gene_type:complete
MKSRILALAGQKQSGKTTASNFLHGYQLRCHNIIKGFIVTDDGKLVIDTEVIRPDGQEETGKVFLDINRNDLEFAQWAAYSMWPYIKRYSFASPLKLIAVEMFGLTKDQCYGTDTQKNTLTNIKWGDMPDLPKGYSKNKKMTAREFLQYFGTDVCRKIKDDIWSDRCIRDIREESPLVAVIDDCRFVNEADAVQRAGGKVIKFTRSAHKDSHSSESALNDWENYDAIIDNENMTINETCIEIIRLLTEWGWLGAEIKQQEIKPPEPELVGGIHKFKEDKQE